MSVFITRQSRAVDAPPSHSFLTASDAQPPTPITCTCTCVCGCNEVVEHGHRACSQLLLVTFARQNHRRLLAAVRALSWRLLFEVLLSCSCRQTHLDVGGASSNRLAVRNGMAGSHTIAWQLLLRDEFAAVAEFACAYGVCCCPAAGAAHEAPHYYSCGSEWTHTSSRGQRTIVFWSSRVGEQQGCLCAVPEEVVTAAVWSLDAIGAAIEALMADKPRMIPIALQLLPHAAASANPQLHHLH